MPFWSRKRVKWIREGLKQYVPYLPYNPRPKKPPPYVPPQPTMVITAPAPNSTVVDNTPTLRGTAPAAGVVTVVIKQGSTTVQTLTPTASGGTWVATAATLADNSYTVTATQGAVTSGPQAFTVDAPGTTPLAITFPAAGQTLQDDTPSIVGTANGTATVTVLVKKAGVLQQTLTATPAGSTWQTTATSLADGVYVLEVSQSGVGGSPVTFTVDMPQPAVVVSSVAGQPAGGQTTDTTPTIVGTAGNASGDSTTVTVLILQGAATVQTLTPTRSGTSWSTTATTLPVGSYTVRASQTSTAGTGTSGDFAFQVSAAAVLPAPTITSPSAGQVLAGNPISFTGTAGTAAGDSTLVTVRVYPAGSSTPSFSQSATRTGGSWSMSFTATVPNGSWQARVEQVGSAGTGVSPLVAFTQQIPSSAPGLAMPRGPVNGFSLAGELYDSVGVCHHPEYFSDGPSSPAMDLAIARIQELGLRHVRLGLWSPANHGATDYQRTQNFAIRERALRGSNQPINALWGTSAEPAYERAQVGIRAVYTITDSNGTFLRPLDGPTGTVPVTNWTVAEGGGRKYNAGNFYNTTWASAGGLQGPNEPTTGRSATAQGVESVRAVQQGLQNAKNARPSQTVLNGGDYIDSKTGRITAGPAKANQLPVVAFHIGHNDWPAFGDYSDGASGADAGCRHIYWGGHSPIVTEAWSNDPGTNSMWYQSDGYNGRMAPGGFLSRKLPMFITETGYIQKPGSDPGSGQRYCPADVVGEYTIRTLLHNWMFGAVRTYLFSLTDISNGSMGYMDTSFNRRASFYAVKNFMQIVGWRQPTNPVPITVGHTFTIGGPDSMSGHTPIADRFDKTVVQTDDDGNEYLIFCTRQKQLWERGSQTYMVPDARDAVLTLPSGTWTTSVCEPAKNAVDSPDDGQAYANPTNGTAFAAAGMAGNGLTQSGNTLTLRMAGLTRVVKIVKTAGDALHTRVVSELNQFANWCTTNSVQGAVTEFAIPTNTDAGAIAADGDEWAGLLETFYARCQAVGLHTLQWVASEVSVGENSVYLSPGYGSALNRAMAAAGPLEAHANDGFMYRGIALTGLEFGDSGSFSNTNPGALHTNYFANSQGSWTYLRSRGIKVARVGFRWERLQPTLGGALNGSYLQAIRDQVTRANVAGVDVVLDCHNYGGYITSSGQLKLGSAGLTSAHFNDLWRRLALEFGPNARVVAYEIMNEPEGLPGGGASWRTLSQSCVNAIRAVDASTQIWVSGYNWSKVQGWVATNGATPWITGTTGIVYVGHHYFDSEASLNLGGPAADSGYAQTYASAVADAVSAGF